MMLCFVCPAMSANSIKNIRTGTQSDDFTRLVIETSEKPNYKWYYEEPNKIICELTNTSIKNISKNLGKNNIVSNVSVSQFGNKKSNTKIAFSLKDSAMPCDKKQLMLLKPDKKNSHRLVLDIKKTDSDNFNEAISKKAKATTKETSSFFFSDNITSLSLTNKDKGLSLKESDNSKKVEKTIVKEEVKTIEKDYKPIIVIDAGHGGKDPGCRGKNGTKEKDIVLSIAKKLAKKLKATGDYHVYLTRETDIFLNLGTRAGIGEKHKADLFISIHANANPSRKTQGYSIYTLSKTASDAEAEKLAEAENASDKIAVDNFEKYEPFVRMALGSLQQHIVAEASISFADELKKAHKKQDIKSIKGKTVRSAPFAVLKSSIPSVLLEIGHLSNPAEEKLLKSDSYQNKIAEAIAKAIDNFDFD